MPYTYVTFDQGHVHRVNGKTFDRDCVAAIQCANANEGRERAFQLFGPKFCFEYHESEFDHHKLFWWPRGIIYVEREHQQECHHEPRT